MASSGIEDGRFIVRHPIVFAPRSVDPAPEAGGLYITSGGVVKTSNGTTWAEPATAAIAAAVPDSINALTVTQARTATVAGADTGTIADGTDFVTVTSANAAHIIILPTPTPGSAVALINGATGYELQSSTPATVAINGGTGASASSAIAASTLVRCVCSSATAWLCSNTTTAGVVTATDAAA